MTLRRKLIVMAAALAALLGMPAATSASATTVWAVGDGADGPETVTTDDQVGAMIGAGPLDGFLYLGDVYSTGTQGSTTNPFREMVWYDDAYGDYKGKSYPTPGNHEWPTRSLSTGYDAYWPQEFTGPHYYSRDIGGWHVISLNSEDPGGVEAIGPGSAQLAWLENDLAAHPGTCTLAFWHKPRFAAASMNDSGETLGSNASTAAAWQALSGRASLVLTGHHHNYQRTKPLGRTGQVVAEGAGITELVVGTGGEGDEHHSFVGQADDQASPDPRLAAWNDTDFGALKMELQPNRADFELIKLGGGALDSGSVDCKTAPSASTGAAAPEAPTSATVRGTVDPNGAETTYHFQYGTTGSYGSQTPEVTAGSGIAPSEVSAPLGGLQPGTTYHYRVVATNSVGTAAGEDATFTTPLTLGVEVGSGPAGPTNDRTPTFDFSSNGLSATFKCSIQQGAAVLGPCSGRRTHTPPAPLPDGNYTFQVTASDELWQSATALRSFRIDGTPPRTTITSGPAGPTRDITPAFSFASSEAGASSECRIDSEAFTPCSSPFTAHPLPDGEHRVEIRSTDGAGNTSTVAARSFSIDATPPRTALTKHPRKKIRTTMGSKRVRFEFSGADNLPTGPLRFKCRVDRGSFASCRSPFIRKVKLGRHRFSVRAVDAAGNLDPTPASYRWRVVRKR